MSHIATIERPHPAPSIAFVIPARNESQTVERVAEVCLLAADQLGSAENVIVVSDSSTDDTATMARRSGARVLELAGEPSKARAMLAGTAATKSELVCFVDGDCLGLSPDHLVRMAEPVLAGDVVMSIGTFDYRWVGGLVRRYTWSSGERVLPRRLIPEADERIDRYNIEIILNERVAAAGGRVASWNLEGVRQRTKREKFGTVAGASATLKMWGQISRSVPEIDLPTYRRYMRSIELWPNDSVQPVNPVVSDVGYVALRLLSSAARLVR